ncbi:SDR family NAD(P)-dependent oxidoreductase, partial [Bacillus cereus]|nr:SDR family NAD(P)-dependent oxidoreductase [Bacillus cereus]
CIVSGTEEAIVDFENELKKKRLMCMRVTIEGAAHSHELDSILDEYASYVSTLTLREPKIPYLSNLTGTWIRPEEATNPVYWVKHMRGTVRFSDGIQELNRDNTSLFIEIGPGNDLSRLTSRLLDYENGNERIFNTVRSVQQDVSDMYFLFSHITRMWVTGISIDWEQFYKDEKRRRIPLPMYSFNKISYKLQGNPYDLGQKLNSKQSKISKNNNISEWFYTPQWKSSTLIEPNHDVNEIWIVFVDQEGLGNELVKDLLNKGQRVVTVEPGFGFNKENNDRFIINPEERTDYVKLLDEVQEICGLPTRIVHMWGITDEERQASIEYVNCKQNLGFYSIFYLTQALGDKNISDSISIRIITNGVQQVIGDEELIPEKSTVLGTSLVVPQEYSYLSCSSIDVVLPVNKELKNRLINQLVEECLSNTNDKMIAYRGNKRFVQTYEPLQLEQPAKEKLPLRKNGVYLITGGLGGIGTILAKHLAQTVQANLVLLTRTGLPNRNEWDMHLKENTMYSERIRKVLEIEETGSKVYVLAADVTDQSQLYEAIHKAEQKFGKINGVIHGAGILGGKTFNLIQELEKEDCEEQFSAKIYGLLNLEECLRNKDLDFCVLMSSISAVLGGLGYVSYAASNIYMDVFVQYINRYSNLPWISVNWSDWKYWEDEEKDMQIGASVHELSMTPEEGVQAFNIALSWKQGDVLIHSPGELQARIDQWVLLNTFNDEKEEELDSTLYHSRPQLLTEYVAPRNEVEEKLSKIWRNIFKVSEVGVHDDLLELGGDSLKAITIVSKIHKEFNVEVPI